MKNVITTFVLGAAAVYGQYSGGGQAGQVRFYSATGSASAIEPTVGRFRSDLGELNPSEPKQFGGGRREINWDGGTAGNDNLPGDFFHTRSPRGLISSTPGLRMKVSGDQGTPAFAMDDIIADKTGATEFVAFSGQKFFATPGSTITDVEFRIPGTQDVACVSGFGAVFMDVDRGGQSFMEVAFLDGSVRKFYVPVAPERSKTFGFVGARVTEGCIVSVRLNAGDTPIDAKPVDGIVGDTVGLDDFIYGEPKPISGSSY